MRLFKNLRTFFDKQQQAVTFAQAGESEYALELITEQKEELVAPTKLLVVGEESSFSEDIIDYAIDMAHRMSYSILALNTAPLSCEVFKLFSSSYNQICKEFERLSEKSADLFQKAAIEKGIPFKHMVMFNETDDALNIIVKEEKDIAFIVSGPVGSISYSRAEDRVYNPIFVYSIVA